MQPNDDTVSLPTKKTGNVCIINNVACLNLLHYPNSLIPFHLREYFYGNLIYVLRSSCKVPSAFAKFWPNLQLLGTFS
jgi:hypothetical protein